MTLRTTREVLGEHLQAKLRGIHPGVDDHVYVSLMNERSEDEIYKLLRDDDELEKAISNLLSNDKNKDVLAEDLFRAVQTVVDKKNLSCSPKQITGMMLELDVNTLASLLTDDEKLVVAVEKAEEEYTRYLQVGNQQK